MLVQPHCQIVCDAYVVTTVDAPEHVDDIVVHVLSMNVITFRSGKNAPSNVRMRMSVRGMSFFMGPVRTPVVGDQYVLYSQ